MQIIKNIRTKEEIIKAINNNSSLTIPEIELLVSDQISAFCATECLSSIGRGNLEPSPFFKIKEDCDFLLQWAGIYRPTLSYQKGIFAIKPQFSLETFNKLVSLCKAS